MRSTILFALVLLAAALTLCGADALNGKWQIHQSVAGNESDVSCTFTQTGSDLSGSCGLSSGVRKITGKVEDRKVTWTMNSEYNGEPLTIKYFGTLHSETKMTGTLTVDPYAVEGEFTAAPAK